MNPDDGVTYNPNNSGLFSGYAWSSNAGWISFGCGQSNGAGGILCSENSGAPDYPSGAGTSPFGPRVDLTNKLVGFARACSVFASGCSGPLRDILELGGWDGWISLNGSTDDGTGEYKVKLNTDTKKD